MELLLLSEGAVAALLDGDFQKARSSTALSRGEFRGVPGYWLDEDMVAALEGASFTNISIISRGERRRPWLVKMDQMERSGERLHTLSIRSDNVVMLLERAVSRRQAATCSVAVPARSKTKPSEAGTSQRVSTRRPLDSSADADMHGGDAEETEQKRQRLTTAAQPASPQVSLRRPTCGTSLWSAAMLDIAFTT